MVALDPVVMFTAPELEHVEIAVPAVAVGACFIVKVFVDIVFPHGALPVAVKVSVTLPAIMSAALGV